MGKGTKKFAQRYWGCLQRETGISCSQRVFLKQKACRFPFGPIWAGWREENVGWRKLLRRHRPSSELTREAKTANRTTAKRVKEREVFSISCSLSSPHQRHLVQKESMRKCPSGGSWPSSPALWCWSTSRRRQATPAPFGFKSSRSGCCEVGENPDEKWLWTQTDF